MINVNIKGKKRKDKNKVDLKTPICFLNNIFGFVFLSILFISAVVLSGCNADTKDDLKKNYPEETREIFAMDTYMTLKAYGKESGSALDSAVSEIERLDDLFSVGNPDSEVSIINEAGSEILSEDAVSVLKEALELYKVTGGAFDVAVFPLMEEWGFTTGNYKVPDEDVINELLGHIDAGEIELDEESGFASLSDDMKIDFGGIVKGYTSARVMDIFKEYDVNCGIVSLGGNVQTYNKKQDGSDGVVAIENPDNTSEFIGKLKVSDKAVITSGGYERYFEDGGVTYHHILYYG